MAAMKEPVIVAIELGTSHIAGIAGKKNNGNFQILAYAEEQTTACIKRGLIYNIEKTTQAIKNVIDKLGNVLNQEITRVYVGIGGQSVRAIKKRVPRNMLTQTAITAEIIDELTKESMDIVNYPDCEILDNIPQGYVIDSVKTPDPQGVFGTNIEGEFINIIARTQLKGNIATCLQSNGLEIAGTPTQAIERAKCTLTEQEKRAGCAMIDLGAGTTTIVVYKQNIVKHLVTIPIGFYNIVEDLKAILQIEDKEATDLLIEKGNAFLETEEEQEEIMGGTYITSNGKTHALQQIHQIIDARLTEIVVNAVAQIVNNDFMDQLLAGIVITGGGANMRNIDKAFNNNDRKKRFEIIRIAKTIVQTPVKASSASNLNLENAMSGTIVALALAGEVNCVGDEEYQGGNLFGRQEKDTKINETIARNDEERKKIDDMFARLDAFKNQMRQQFNALDAAAREFNDDQNNKNKRNETENEINNAKAVCSEIYQTLLNSLETRFPNDQRITEAKKLEKTLNELISQTQQTIQTSKANNKFTARIARWLESVVGDN